MLRAHSHRDRARGSSVASAAEGGAEAHATRGAATIGGQGCTHTRKKKSGALSPHMLRGEFCQPQVMEHERAMLGLQILLCHVAHVP